MTHRIVCSLAATTALAMGLMVSQGRSQSSALLQFEAASIKAETPFPAGGAASAPLFCNGIDGSDTLPQDPAGILPASVPRGRCVGRYVHVSALVVNAFGVRQWNVEGQMQDGTVGFQIEAKAENPATATRTQLRQMLLSLLVDRFKLKFHTDNRESQGFIVVAGKNGLKLKEAAGPEEPLVRKNPGGGGGGGQRSTEPPSGPQTTVITGKTTLQAFASFVGSCGFAGQVPVVDRTELKGIYDFNLTLHPTRLALPPPPPPGGGIPLEVQRAICSPNFDPPLNKALEDQLGLRLEPQKLPETFIVVDHWEKPSEN